jgi:hypothetical protein
MVHLCFDASEFFQVDLHSKESKYVRFFFGFPGFISNLRGKLIYERAH